MAASVSRCVHGLARGGSGAARRSTTSHSMMGSTSVAKSISAGAAVTKRV